MKALSTYICSVAAIMILTSASKAELVIGLTSGNQLVNFDTASPGFSTSLSITGLTGGDVLSGIDRRPLNGVLYGFAVNGSTGRIYSINSATGAATVASTLSASLNGNFFGIDFNPTVDRLRIVSDTGQNLRVNVDSGATLTDAGLQFAAGDPNNGVTPQVVAAAYSNNVSTATTTTLYTLDAATQSLLIQSPPNNGTLNAVSPLGSIIFPEAAFDISGESGFGYAILNGFELTRVDLSNGSTTSLGFINSPGSIIGLAAPVGVPEPSSLMLAGIAACGYCLSRKRREIV